MKKVLEILLATLAFTTTASASDFEELDPRYERIAKQCGNAAFSAIIYLRSYPGNGPQAIQKRERAYSQLNLHDNSTSQQMEIVYDVIGSLHEAATPEQLADAKKMGLRVHSMESGFAAAICTADEIQSLK